VGLCLGALVVLGGRVVSYGRGTLVPMQVDGFLLGCFLWARYPCTDAGGRFLMELFLKDEVPLYRCRWT